MATFAAMQKAGNRLRRKPPALRPDIATFRGQKGFARRGHLKAERMKLGRACRAAAIAVAILASDLASGPAAAQGVDCSRLAQQIASLGHGAGSDRARSAAQKQQGELVRMTNYARSIGCDKPQFLFFGSRPPQCEGVNAHIQRMQANLSQLQGAASGDSGLKRQLQNQYETWCRGGQPREPNFLERLFGAEPTRTYPPESVPVPDDPHQVEERRPSGGPMAVCVRSCDGGFFPVSYSARRADLDQLQELCTALCPNTEVKVYTRSLSRDMKSAVSAEGVAYTEMPNAFKFEKVADATCTCKPPDKSWVEALADAERVLGEERKGDMIVTPAQAEEMSRPKTANAVAPPASSKAHKFDPSAAQKLLDERKAADAQSEAERAIAAQAPTAGSESSGIDVGRDHTGAISGPGVVRDEPTPDGARRKMRVLGQ